jgi:hypothetical protein
MTVSQAWAALYLLGLGVVIGAVLTALVGYHLAWVRRHHRTEEES